MIRATIIDKRNGNTIIKKYFKTEDQLVTWLRNRLLRSRYGSHDNELLKLKTPEFERIFHIVEWQMGKEFGKNWQAIPTDEDTWDFSNLEDLTVRIENETCFSYEQYKIKL